jgi:hypothetical protein
LDQSGEQPERKGAQREPAAPSGLHSPSHPADFPQGPRHRPSGGVEAIKRGEEEMTPVDAHFLPGGRDALPGSAP